MVQIREDILPEYEIYEILANRRRREAIRHIGSVPGRISVRELTEVIAQEEAGADPAPRNVRESVYSSLHQRHLPKLEDLGMINYDRTEAEVELLERGQHIDLYMGVVTRYGITWAEFYRAIGVVSLFLVVGSLIDVPMLELVDPLIWASGALAIFAVASGYQLWTHRWHVLRVLGI